MEEVKARNGKIIAITTKGNDELDDIVSDTIHIPKTLEMLTPVLACIPLYLFAAYVGIEKGLDIDKPRNLAKSVTVE
jgi:glucosamine--fructose-6-phosphate aminotransferase (isomerizing)